MQKPTQLSAAALVADNHPSKYYNMSCLNRYQYLLREYIRRKRRQKACACLIHVSGEMYYENWNNTHRVCYIFFSQKVLVLVLGKRKKRGGGEKMPF